MSRGELEDLAWRQREALRSLANRLGEDSTTSSRPPSSDDPYRRGEREKPASAGADGGGEGKTPSAKLEKTVEPGARKAGKRPGSKGFWRSQPIVISAEVPHAPTDCAACRAALGLDGERRCVGAHNSLELARGVMSVQVTATKHVYFAVRCPCGHETVARPGVGLCSEIEGRRRDLQMSERCLVGPMLATLIAALSVRFLLSRRKIQEFLLDWLGLELGAATTDGRFGLVDVLAPGPAGFERFDPQVFGFDLHLDVFAGFDFGDDVDRSERRMPPVRRIERRDAHQAVHAALALEHSVRVLAAHEERDRLQSRFVARRLVDHGGIEALRLGPAQVHPPEDRDPVGGVGAAGAGMDRDDRAVVVVLAVEIGRHLELVDAGLGAGERRVDFLIHARLAAEHPSVSSASSRMRATVVSASTSSRVSAICFIVRCAAWASFQKSSARERDSSSASLLPSLLGQRRTASASNFSCKRVNALSWDSLIAGSGRRTFVPSRRLSTAPPRQPPAPPLTAATAPPGAHFCRR